MVYPSFEPVDLTQLWVDGVLMAANERFFWPLGLALTWDYDPETGEASGLHIREWLYEDAHHESISLEDGDDVAVDRRIQFDSFALTRMATMPASEREGVLRVLRSLSSDAGGSEP